MPLDPLHKKKRMKNLAVLALVFGFCALVWAITVIRIAQGS